MSVLAVLILTPGCQDEQQGRSDRVGFAVIGSPTHDFGEHRQGQVLTHTFELRNDYSVPVKIRGVTTSCSCLVADSDLTTTTVEPGDCFALPVHFTTGGASDTAAGRVTLAYVRLRDGSEVGEVETVGLRVQASVSPDYRLFPVVLDFGVVDGLSPLPLTKVVKIVPEADPNVQVDGITSVPGYLRAKLLPEESGSVERNIEVTLDVSKFARSRVLDTSIVVATSSELRPHALVRVRAKYQAPVEAKPDALIISSDNRGRVSRELTLVSSRPTRFVAARCPSNEQIVIECDLGKVAKEHVTHLHVPPSADGPINTELLARLEVLLDSGKTSIVNLKIPIHRFQERTTDAHKP